MDSPTNFILLDEGSFVKSFDYDQQKLIMTLDRTEALPLTKAQALEVVERLEYLASERLVVKASQRVEPTMKPCMESI